MEAECRARQQSPQAAFMLCRVVILLFFGGGAGYERDPPARAVGLGP